MRFLGLRLFIARAWRRIVEAELDYTECQYQQHRREALEMLVKAIARETDLRQRLARHKGHRTGDELVGIACIAAALALPLIPAESAPDQPPQTHMETP